MALSKEEIIEAIKEMSVLDMADLVKALEDEIKNPMNVHRWRKL